MGTRPLTELWSLSGRVALVTGGGRGLGLAIARRLCEAGANVVVNDIDAEAVGSAVTGLTDAGGHATAAVADIATDDGVPEAIRAAVDTYGRLDVLVNNAGLVPLQPLDEMSRAAWDHLMAVNVRGALLLTDAGSRQMIKQGEGGSIINVLSVGAVRALQPELIAYCASKAALQMGTQVHARALAVHKIRVNGLLPSVMMTDSTDAIPDLAVPSIPLGRLVDPDEVARGAVFLAGDMAEFVTGVTLPVDGGRLVS